jgi:hypothetical protein
LCPKRPCSKNAVKAISLSVKKPDFLKNKDIVAYQNEKEWNEARFILCPKKKPLVISFNIIFGDYRSIFVFFDFVGVANRDGEWVNSEFFICLYFFFF